ncbi:GDP-L-fucose synthase [Thiotrichales bacterium 19S3-7]|nr:GDP-L-fucose synthase [Thiotrichales bacterium 19S3-7]MCF6800694.1 GDP-L-fucose synthase [Thiotrichales bacterium 19S3-11]
MMRILISGGNGMLGRNILEHAKTKQYQIFSPTSEVLDLLDSQAIVKYLEENQIEFVIHCAGVVGGIQANIKDPVTYLNNNLLMGVNLINAAFKANIQGFLNVGSSCMYPKDYMNPLKESYLLQAPLEPTNEGYALAKIVTAKLCEYYSLQYGLAYKTVIPCNLYGRWDKFSDQHSHMLPAVIKKIYHAQDKKLSHVDIWGSGKVRREFMYAGDCADAILFCIEKFDQLTHYTNIGLGFDYSINEYYQIIAKILGYQGEFKHDLTKPEGMKQKLVDVTKIKQLGWQPLTSLEAGISKTVDFYKKGILCMTQH